MLSPGAGMLGAKREAQIQTGAPQWGLFAEIERTTSNHTIGMAYLKNKQRQLKIDGVDSARQTDLSDLGHVVWFNPKYDRLFFDAAKPRRDFIDRMTFALCDDHAEMVNRYRHHLRSRLRLLKDGIKGDWLDLEEERVAKYGAQLMKNREHYLEMLKEYLPELSLGMAGSAQAVLEAEDVAAKIQEHLVLGRDRDAQYGDTHFGPHRSDISGELILEGRQVPLTQVSSGQHKRAILAWLLAHVRLLKAEKGQAPLVLLDEVLAHLDESVSAKVLQELTDLGAQIWIAGTEADPFLASCERLKIS